MPHETVDPIPPAIAIAQAMPTIVSRNNYALDDLVISVTQIHAGTVDNVIPETAFINGTVRSFDPACRTWSSGAWARSWRARRRPSGSGAARLRAAAIPRRSTIPRPRAFAAEVAAEVVGAEMVDAECGREMGAEDFAYMLQERPGAYLFLGAGPGAGLHHPKFDFNDEIAPIGRELLRAARGDGAAA
jgi:metal-dependent amidase/aminoacylase/carboxypeptidase family protein